MQSKRSVNVPKQNCDRPIDGFALDVIYGGHVGGTTLRNILLVPLSDPAGVAGGWHYCLSIPERLIANQELLVLYIVFIFYVDPNFVVVNLYDNVTLTCPFNTQSIKFSKDSQPIGVGQTTTQNRKYLISGNSLTLIRFVIMDNGLYSCSGRDANGGTKTFNWALHINLTTTSSKYCAYTPSPLLATRAL